jgi:hypothetical protein
VINNGKFRYYRNIYSFIARIKIAVFTRNVVIIRQNLDMCLKEEAENWWVNQLINIKCQKFIIDLTELNKWIEILKIRFRKLLSIVIFKFFKIKYTVADIKNYQKLSEYIIKIIAAAKIYGYADTEYV